MKKQMSPLLAILLLPSFFTSAALAESVTVGISATVSSVDDPYGVVPEIAPGAGVGGNYTYETLTPDQDPLPEKGSYPHEGNSGFLNLSLGPYQVQTDTSLGGGAFDIDIDDEYNPGWEWYMVFSHQLLPNNGVIFESAVIDLGGDNGGALESAALTVTPPDPMLFNINRNIYIHGTKDGLPFSVVADVNGLSVEGQTATQQTPYEYKANAVVTFVDDPAGMLAGRLGLNDPITAGFVYDQATANTGPYPEEGIYLHEPGTGKVSVAFADVLLETDPAALTPEVHVFNSTDPLYLDHVGVLGKTVNSNNAAITAYEIVVVFEGADTVLSTTELPADTLSLPDWQAARVIVFGDGWSFEAALTGLELVQTQAVTIFPADGLVHPQQGFDMVLRANEQPAVVGLQGMNNGQDISSYLAGCAILPKLDTTQSILCPSTTMVLGVGTNDLQFQLMLDGGGTLDTTVNWEVRD